MRIITLADVQYITFQLAKEHLSFDELIPDFSIRFPNLLESCVVTPFQKFSGRPLYPTLVAKAGVLFYLMNKNRPFQNGNKRIAMTTLLTFLFFNNKWLQADIQELFNVTMWVAQSPAELKEDVIAGIQRFVQNHLISAG